jgi:hypothetical protein
MLGNFVNRCLHGFHMPAAIRGNDDIVLRLGCSFCLSQAEKQNCSYEPTNFHFSAVNALRERRLQKLVFEMAFAFRCFRILVFAQNIFIQLHICAEKILESDLDPLLVCCHSGPKEHLPFCSILRIKGKGTLVSAAAKFFRSLRLDWSERRFWTNGRRSRSNGGEFVREK